MSGLKTSALTGYKRALGMGELKVVRAERDGL
jgi:hypothetical protein